jgi:hypothetical protein
MTRDCGLEYRDVGGVAQPGQSSGFISRVSLVQIQSPLIPFVNETPSG